jgi:hypothetical protein
MKREKMKGEKKNSDAALVEAKGIVVWRDEEMVLVRDTV